MDWFSLRLQVRPGWVGGIYGWTVRQPGRDGTAVAGRSLPILHARQGSKTLPAPGRLSQKSAFNEIARARSWQGAFLFPLLAQLVEACRYQKNSYDRLLPISRAFEVDAQVAVALRSRCGDALEELGVARSKAREIARAWVTNQDFLEARPRTRFTHIVGDPSFHTASVALAKAIPSRA